MATQNSVAISDDLHEAGQVLDELGARAEAQVLHWIEVRSSVRRPLRVRCYVRHIDMFRDAVVAVKGLTRDLSRGGLGFISRTHFQRHEWVGVTLELQSDTRKYLTGTVCYSKPAEEGWYLTGVRFAKTDDSRLATLPEDIAAELSETTGPEDSAKPTMVSGSTRQGTLDMLAAASAMRSLPKEAVTKVVLASMSQDHTVRLAAIPVLSGLPTRDGVKALIRLLDDDNPEVQSQAAQALGGRKAAEAIDPLRRLLRSSDEAVVLHAAEAMARLGDTGGLRAVARILKHNAPAARHAVRVLGVIAGRRFAPGAEGVTAALAYLKSNGF